MVILLMDSDLDGEVGACFHNQFSLRTILITRKSWPFAFPTSRSRSNRFNYQKSDMVARIGKGGKNVPAWVRMQPAPSIREITKSIVRVPKTARRSIEVGRN